MKEKQTNKSSDFEKIEKENATLYTNAKTLFGEDGQKVIDDVLKAFDYAINAIDTTVKEKTSDKNSNKFMEECISSIANSPLYKSAIKALKDELVGKTTAEDNSVNAETDNHKCCNGKCACTTPCKNCTCDTSVKTDVIENDDTKDESGSANFIRRRHLDYMNSLTDTKQLYTETPLPDALRRVAEQAGDAIDEINSSENFYELSPVEDEFVMSIMDRLIKVLDASFITKGENAAVQTYNDVLAHDDFRFTGLIGYDDEPFGVALKLNLDDYPTEIYHRLVQDVDNGRLIELVATYAGFDADAVFFEWSESNSNSGELFFIFEN